MNGHIRMPVAGSDVLDVKKQNSALIGFSLGAIGLIPHITAVIWANSLTMAADTVKTACETLALFIAWVMQRRISKGRMKNYDYGHGKLEVLIGLGIAIAMLFSMGIIIAGGIDRLRHPVAVNSHGVLLGILLTTNSLVINLLMWNRNRKIVKQQKSPSIDAQMKLFRTKAFGNVAVITALILSITVHQSWAHYIDPCTSFVISGFLLYSVLTIIFRSIKQLLDKALDEGEQLLIMKELVRCEAGFEDFHGIRTRRSGSDLYIDILLEFNERMTMREAQQTIHQVIERLEPQIAGSRISVIPTVMPEVVPEVEPKIMPKG